MTYSCLWKAHPDALCRQYDKQASGNLFLKPGNKSTIWKIDTKPELAPSPVISENSTSTCVDTARPTVMSPGGCPNVIDAKNGIRAPFSEVELHEESDVVEIFANNPHIFHIKNTTSSWSRLGTTQRIFEALCLKLEIFEAFRENIAFMGRRFHELEVAPPRCESQIIESRIRSEIDVSLEFTYILRYVNINAGNDDSRPWSVRQMAVYNRHASLSESSWVFISLPDQVLGAVDDYVQSTSTSQPLERCLRLHLSLFTFPVRSWRPYLIYLAREIEKCNGTVTCAAPPTSLRIDLSQLRVRMKNLESQIDDALLAIQTNSLTTGDVLTLLAEYLTHSKVAKAETSEVKASLDSFRVRCEKDYALIILKLESLRCRLQSCIQMASSFAEIMNGQALGQNSQSLRKLAEEQTEEARHMGLLADKSRRDTMAVKGLSIITLIYLPTTVVLNFFSASFIDNSSGRMVLVGQWWLFLVVGLPLTIVTLATWAFWIKYGLPKAERKCLDIEKGL